MNDVVIVAAGRTAVGKFGGALAKFPAADLGAHVIKGLLAKTGLKPEQISEVILGQVLTAGVGQNAARQAAIRAGLPDMVPAMTINKVCGSGLKATHLAAQAIKAGDAEIIIAGGQENMSISPHVLAGSRDGFRMGDAKLVDTMIVDGLWDAYNQYHMGVTAENVAAKYGVTRADQDAFALASQLKTEAAQKAGKFNDEILPFDIPQRKGAPSLMPEALPAVTVPFLSKAARSPASASMVLPCLGYSSASNTSGAPFLCGISNGRISSLNLPAFCAASVFSCEASAKASWSARVTPYLAATFSAVTPMWYWLYASHKPSTIMVSTSLASPMRKPSREPASTCGEMLMFSWPPAMIISASPALIA